MHIYIGNTELLPLSEMNSRCSSSGSSRRRRHLPAPQSVSRGQKNAWQQPPPRQEDAALVFPTVFFVLLSFHPTLSLSLSLFCKHGHECKFTCARHHSGIFHLLSCLEDAQSQRGMLEGKKKKKNMHPSPSITAGSFSVAGIFKFSHLSGEISRWGGLFVWISCSKRQHCAAKCLRKITL